MTQIKLRRDTSANFTSKNPVLGVGEPAYETDTKKLKIGDGTTAYTQLEYFSTGGGGSTNITATLPLKIVDGVISLEVDGQTIQIVDGKLHANLDELGNEVNSLTGEVTDLSGRVTAAEADILTKENKITATGALSLQEKIISNLTNMTETETQITPNKTQDFVLAQYKFYFGSPTYNAPQCYIAIPYQFGQWLKIPGGYNTQPTVFFGHFLEDGDFLITAVFSGNCYERNYPIYGGIVRDRAPVSFSTYSDILYLNSYSTVSEKAMNSDIIFTETDPCAYLQLIDNTSSNNIVCGSFNYGYGPNSDSIKGYAETHVVYNRDLTNYTVQDFVRDTTTALIMSPSDSYPILKSAVGLYAATGRLGWNQEGYNQLKANLGENFFSQVNNYLELNLGDGLSVVDGKLTASSTAPANIVTTDTTQTISGDKTLTGITTISNDMKFTIGKKITTPDGVWLMQLGPGFIGIGTSMNPLQTFDGGNYYLHNKSIIAGAGIEITEPSNTEIKISSTIGNMAAYVTETYVNGTSWYRIWSDGWCEQGGYINSDVSTPSNGVVVTFLKPFLDSNYTITMLSGHNDNTTNNLSVPFGNAFYGCYQSSFKTANTIRLCGEGTWYACGYIS